MLSALWLAQQKEERESEGELLALGKSGSCSTNLIKDEGQISIRKYIRRPPSVMMLPH